MGGVAPCGDHALSPTDDHSRVNPRTHAESPEGTTEPTVAPLSGRRTAAVPTVEGEDRCDVEACGTRSHCASTARRMTVYPASSTPMSRDSHASIDSKHLRCAEGKNQDAG